MLVCPRDQSQCTDTEPDNPSTDPITADARLGSH